MNYKCLITKHPQKYLNFKKNEENTQFTILHNYKRDLYSPSNFVRVLKFRRLQLPRHVARMGGTKA